MTTVMTRKIRKQRHGLADVGDATTVTITDMRGVCFSVSRKILGASYVWVSLRLGRERQAAPDSSTIFRRLRLYWYSTVRSIGDGCRD